MNAKKKKSEEKIPTLKQNSQGEVDPPLNKIGC
jgi:hypothetical protein